MATADVQAVVPSSVSDGVLVVPCSGGDERYEVMKVPAESASWVQDAKKKVLVNLKLESVLKDLDRVSDLLFLAYMSVIGSTGDLQCRILRRQSDLSNLYTEFVNTINGLQQDSRKVLSRLTEAYSYLLEAKEVHAVHVFAKCGKNWSTMSTKLDELADGFKKMEDDTMEDAAFTYRARGDELQKIEALQKSRSQMEETKKRQEELGHAINTNLGELKIKIDEEEARKHSANANSITSRLIGAFAGAIGGFGGPKSAADFVSFAQSLYHRHLEVQEKNSKRQADQAKELIDSILNNLKKKSEQETRRRDAVEALISRLLETNSKPSALETATWALEIATQTLGHIRVSLSEAKLFWDSKQRFCADLADPKVADKIQDEMKKGATPEERIQYYKSDRFVPIAIRYLCEWTALAYVCGEYIVRVDHAGLSAQHHIKASPTAEEARKLIEPLKKEIHDELKADAEHLDSKINAFNDGAEKVKALMQSYE